MTTQSVSSSIKVTFALWHTRLRWLYDRSSQQQALWFQLHPLSVVCAFCVSRSALLEGYWTLNSDLLEIHKFLFVPHSLNWEQRWPHIDFKLVSKRGLKRAFCCRYKPTFSRFLLALWSGLFIGVGRRSSWRLSQWLLTAASCDTFVWSDHSR